MENLQILDYFFQNCIYVEIDIYIMLIVCFQSELCFKQNGCGDSNRAYTSLPIQMMQMLLKWMEIR